MNRCLLATSLLLSLSASGVARPPAVATLDLNAYLAEIDRWDTAVRRLTDHPQEAARLRQSLPSAWSVDLDGQAFSVSTAWIRTSLASLEKDPTSACITVSEITSRLKSLRLDAKAVGREPPPSPSQARSDLERVLRRREFRGVRGPSPVEIWRNRLWASLSRLWEKLFGGLSSHPRVGLVIAWIFAAIAGLLLVVWIAGSVLASRSATTLDLKGRLVLPRTWRDWAREALERAARGDYRDAIRLAYWSAVYRLAELGAWQVELDRTPREYLRLLPRDHAHQAPLAAVTRQFEDAWYAARAVSSEDFASAIHQLDKDGMRAPLEPGDRKILIICGAALVVLTLAGALLSPTSHGLHPPFPSSFSAASDGSKAAYLFLAERGSDVERWASPPRDLPDPSSADLVLVLADPLVPASAEEKQQLRGFVARGGRILTTGASAAMLFSDRPVRYASPFAGPWEEFGAESPAPLTRGAPKILMNSQTRWRSPHAGENRYYGDAEGGVVVSFRIGSGEVVWWAGSAPLTNYGLTQASNLMLFLNSLGEERGHSRRSARLRILWDEYFHGQRRTLWSYLARTPLPWALLQLVALSIAIFLTFGRRSGPLRSSSVAGARFSPLEFVETVGDLYHRKHAASLAVDTAYRRFRRKVTARFGLASDSTAEAIYRSVRERLDWKVPGFWETLRDCESAIRNADVGEGKALTLVQDLQDYARRFGLETPGSRGA